MRKLLARGTEERLVHDCTLLEVYTMVSILIQPF